MQNSEGANMDDGVHVVVARARMHVLKVRHKFIN